MKDASKTAAATGAHPRTCSEADLLEKLTDTKSSFKYLVRKVDPSIGTRVKSARSSTGIGVLSEPKRVYPKGALAPQLLGFVGGTEYTRHGGPGVRSTTRCCPARPGTMQVVRDLSGNRLSTISTKDAKPGKSITLTIDAEIQFEAEKVLADAVEEFEAKKACALVMDPRTGEILAMANTPVFNPDAYGSQDRSTGGTRNWLVTDMYEPGSTFKMVTVAAALENGVVDSRHHVHPARRITAYDEVIHEADEERVPRCGPSPSPRSCPSRRTSARSRWARRWARTASWT